MRSTGLLLAALLLSACGGSGTGAPGPSGSGAALVPGDVTCADGVADLASPKWQSVMKNCRLVGDPRVPNFVSPEGEILKIWPTMQFWTYVPPSAGPNPALVVYLHGSTQDAERAARGVRWNELADREGFMVVYPSQAENTWNWGQTTAYGRGVGDLESVYRITRWVQSTFKTDPARTYILGTSSGAITSTMLASNYAEAFTAVGSIMGSSYNESDPHGEQGYAAMGENAKLVPGFHVHGNADHLFPPPIGYAADTGWAGTNDWADNGEADGSISPIPEIDDSHSSPVMAEPGAPKQTCPGENNNPCLGQELGYATYGYEVHRYRQAGGAGCVLVEGWMVNGLAHNYVGGDLEGTFVDPTGPDITTAAWEFFEQATACLGGSPSP